jgi:hypothetical protein
LGGCDHAIRNIPLHGKKRVCMNLPLSREESWCFPGAMLLTGFTSSVSPKDRCSSLLLYSSSTLNVDILIGPSLLPRRP